MRRPARLVMGELALTLFPNGRVLVEVPPARTLFGVSLDATVLYPSLRAALAAVRARPFAT